VVSVGSLDLLSEVVVTLFMVEVSLHLNVEPTSCSADNKARSEGCLTALDLADTDGLLCLSLENGRKAPPILCLESEKRFKFVGKSCSWLDLTRESCCFNGSSGEDDFSFLHSRVSES